ncbi:MAG: hypothetical protein HOO93_03035 [Methyloglobulus sp.]|nr:hypothetical protein [Methyloglobulus sp.]
MKSVLLIASCMLVSWLSGCAQQAIMPPLPETAVNIITKDATGQLTSLYPPAQTHFVMVQGEPDLLGNQFKNKLRNCGYALHENQENTAANQPVGIQLSYLLDALTDVSHYGYYRLTLNIGKEQLSRLYDASDLTQPNYWSYRK